MSATPGPDRTASTAEPYISVVIPVYNEVDSLPELHVQLTAGLEATGRTYEILFIDDGSRDGSAERLDEIASRDPCIRVVHFRRNFGKSPALAAAFDRVRGQIVLTLDADLQDDPGMIPDFVARIEAGADLVSGWKQRRHDPIGKTLPSKFFNFVVRKVSGVQLRDFNCGFKAYRIDCIRELSVYGGFHRFLPVLAGERGFRVEELVVKHRARQHGVSKFGIKRFFDGFLDLLTVLMVTHFRTRPVHFFGILGTTSGVLGVGTLAYLSALWFMGESIGSRPLLLLGVLLTLTAIQFIAIGLVAELLVRTTISSTEVYSVAREFGAGVEPRAIGTITPAPSLPATVDPGVLPPSATAEPAPSVVPKPPPIGVASARTSE